MRPILLPTSAEEAREAVARCHGERRVLTVCGAGTRGFERRGQPIATTALRDWSFLEPNDMVMGAAAGLPLAEVHARLDQVGMVLPVASFFAGATLGGLVAGNEWGPERLERGGVRDQLIGIEYVDGGARLVKSGGRVVKNVTGYDLGKMMVGSLGGLGLITALNFKLQPLALNPRRALLRMRGPHWLSWLRDEVHRPALPLDFFQAIHRGGEWFLAMGFSGQPARVERIAAQLSAVFGESLELEPDNEQGRVSAADWRAFAPSVRRHGFLEPHRQAYGDDFFHLHLIAPSRTFLDRPRCHEALVALPETTVVLHPIGGDAHLLGPATLLSEAHIDRLRRVMAGSGGYLVLERAHPELLRIYGTCVPLPSEYPLQQRIKRQLDPRELYHSPFYHQV